MDKNEIVNEIKGLIDPLGRAFEAYRTENDKQIKELKDGKSDPILAEKIDKINVELDKITAMKTQLEAKLTAVEAAVARGEFQGGNTVSEIDKIKSEHKAAFEKWFRRGGEAQYSAVHDLQIKAGLSTLSDPDGGYLITPPEFDTAIDRVAGTMSAMRRLATVRTIGTDTYKKLVNQGGSTSGWVAEKATRAETDTPVLREIAINTKEIYAMPGCTQISLDDATIDLASWLADEASIEFAEEEGSAHITGNGVEKPHGIAAYTMIADASYSWGKVGFITSGHATLINNADKLMDVVLALKPMYLNGSSWLMNRATIGKIRQLKNGEGDYIWRPGLEAGAPNVLFGYPVETDDNVANIGAGTFPAFFGNFKRAYLIIDRMGIRILRDPYTSKGNVLFYMTKRTGGGLVGFESLKAFKVSA
jgi:HK97 family phage major capsid protein